MAGVKHDEKKLKVDLIPSEPIEALAAILTYGSTEKPNPDGTKGYGDNNWMEGLKFRKVYGAMLRHLLAYRRGEYQDQESGHPHLWHAFCNLMFLIYYNHPNHYVRYEKFNDFKQEWAQKLAQETIPEVKKECDNCWYDPAFYSCCTYCDTNCSKWKPKNAN